METGVIYRHFLINDKGIERNYIGLHHGELPSKHRWGLNGEGYLRKYKNGREQHHKMARAIRKYGWDKFNHEILLTIRCETKEELSFWLNTWETYYIEKYNSYYNGYNSTFGGGGIKGYKYTDEQRKNISDAQIKKWQDDKYRQMMQYSAKKAWEDEDRREKISDRIRELRNNPSSNYNTKEHEKTFKKALKEKVHTPENMAKISEKHKKSWANPNSAYRSEECRRKMSEAKKGVLVGSKNGNANAVKCLETGMEFGSVKEAAKWCGLKGSARIGQCAKGTRECAGRHPITGEALHWEYILKEEE